MSIPAKRVETREEFVCAMTVLGENDALTVHSGKRHTTLKEADQAEYAGERGRRGNKLPRGFRSIERMGPSE